MAINIPIITSLEDSGIKAAKAAFGNFKTSVADAEGGMGKFKAGAGAALAPASEHCAPFEPPRRNFRAGFHRCHRPPYPQETKA